MYYKYEKNKKYIYNTTNNNSYRCPNTIIFIIIFKAIDDNTWIDFFGGYLGSIISAIVAGGLAFYISNAESERQRIQLDKQLEAQKENRY